MVKEASPGLPEREEEREKLSSALYVAHTTCVYLDIKVGLKRELNLFRGLFQRYSTKLCVGRGVSTRFCVGRRMLTRLRLNVARRMLTRLRLYVARRTLTRLCVASLAILWGGLLFHEMLIN